MSRRRSRRAAPRSLRGRARPRRGAASRQRLDAPAGVERPLHVEARAPVVGHVRIDDLAAARAAAIAERLDVVRPRVAALQRDLRQGVGASAPATRGLAGVAAARRARRGGGWRRVPRRDRLARASARTASAASCAAAGCRQAAATSAADSAATRRMSLVVGRRDHERLSGRVRGRRGCPPRADALDEDVLERRRDLADAHALEPASESAARAARGGLAPRALGRARASARRTSARRRPPAAADDAATRARERLGEHLEHFARDRPSRRRVGSSSASSRPSCSSATREQRSASSRYGVAITIVSPCVQELREQLPELAPRHGVDAGRRLVEQNEVGLVHERARERELLLHAARQLVGEPRRGTA